MHANSILKKNQFPWVRFCQCLCWRTSPCLL